MLEKQGKTEGVMFRLYAPCASDVSIVGDFNDWSMYAHKMNKVDDSGVWELFIPHLQNYQSYKYHFKNARGKYVDKADPCAFFSEVRPNTCSRLFDYQGFKWNDQEWMENRTRNFDKPCSIYEMHFGSWVGKDGERFYSYDELFTLEEGAEEIYISITGSALPNTASLEFNADEQNINTIKKSNIIICPTCKHSCIVDIDKNYEVILTEL